MGCLKLKYLENPSPLKVVYSANEAEQKPVQGFWAVDPLSSKYPYNSPYAFSENMVINAIEIEGIEAEILFDKETNTLYARNTNEWDDSRPTKYVTAQEYKHESDWGVDEVRYNQVLVIENVFTGGRMVDGEFQAETTNAERPIPNGKYDITTNPGDENPKHKHWFRLDRWDGDYYDDQDDDHTNSSGEKRSGYRLHPGKISHGCVTVSKDHDVSGYSYITLGLLIYESDGRIHKKDQRGWQGYNPFGNYLTDLGDLKVVDKNPKINGTVDFNEHFGFPDFMKK